MLFVQSITLRYQKNVRYAGYADQRRSVRFWELPQERPEENEIFSHTVFLEQNTEKINCRSSSLRTYGEEGFYDGGVNGTPFSGRLAVTKEGEDFRVKYCGKRDLGFYSTKMILRPGEYGRVIFNERGGYDYTGIWYYDLVTYNFVNAPYSEYRQKLFFCKEPDHEFQDMQYLRYSG